MNKWKQFIDEPQLQDELWTLYWTVRISKCLKKHRFKYVKRTGLVLTRLSSVTVNSVTPSVERGQGNHSPLAPCALAHFLSWPWLCVVPEALFCTVLIHTSCSHALEWALFFIRVLIEISRISQSIWMKLCKMHSLRRPSLTAWGLVVSALLL